MLNNILIIGLGMMGGSLCKSIKKNKISKKTYQPLIKTCRLLHML